MEPCTVAVLAGVFLGFTLGAGAQPRGLARAIGGDKAAKLVRLLELLEEPEAAEAREDDEPGAAE